MKSSLLAFPQAGGGEQSESPSQWCFLDTPSLRQCVPNLFIIEKGGFPKPVWVLSSIHWYITLSYMYIRQPIYSCRSFQIEKAKQIAVKSSWVLWAQPGSLKFSSTQAFLFKTGILIHQCEEVLLKKITLPLEVRELIIWTSVFRHPPQRTKNRVCWLELFKTWLSVLTR